MDQFSKTYHNHLILIALAILVFSCSDSSNQENSKFVSDKAVDSVRSWIESARQRNQKTPFRLRQLGKATKIARKTENDSLRATFFSMISLEYLNIGDSLRFRQTNSETMKLAIKIGDSTKQAEAHWDLAEFYQTKAVVDSSYFHFSKAQKIYSDLGKEFQSGKMLYNMAVAQADIKDYTGSEINAVRAIEIFKPLNKHVQLYRCYSILGSVTKELKEYDRAIEYLNIALQYQEKIERENHYNLKLNNNIGTAYQEQGQYKKSIPYFEEVIKYKRTLEKDPKLYAQALNNLAYSQLKTGKKNGLKAQFEKAIKTQDSIGDITSISRSFYNFSEFYLDRKDTTQAFHYAKKALYNSKKANNFERLLSTLQLLVKLEPNKSIAYNNEYIELNDSLQQIERKVRNKFARIRFETDEFIAENEMLAREKQLWSGIAIAVLLLGLMSYFIVDQRAKNQKLRFQQEQQAANQEIFNLMLAQNQKVEEGKKSEQKRISEELHDGVLGKMLGARMVLTGLNKKTDADAELQREKAIDALQDVEKEVRAISHELSHAAYQKINNFIHSLEDLLKTVQATGKFDYKFTYDEQFDWDGLNGEMKINVYRMIQESLQNCVKHAKCKNVLVSLTMKKEGLEVLVSDDGKGFKKKTGKKGIGMRNIASRIDKLNGSWNIESVLGKGTTVTLLIPVAPIEKNKNQVTEEEGVLREV